jgi:hypothetical protein
VLTKAVRADGRRWDDNAAQRVLLPAQRGPSTLERVEPEPEPAAPRTSRLRAVFERAPLDPGSARIVLVGLLLFGALVTELSTPPPPEHVPSQPSSQHGPAEPGPRR